MGQLRLVDDEEPGVPWSYFLGLWAPAVVLSTGVILAVFDGGLVEVVLFSLSLPLALAAVNAWHRRRVYKAREAKRSVG